MRIVTKLVVSFATVIGLSAIMGTVGLRGLTSVSNDLESVGTVRGPSIEHLLTIQQGFYGVRAANSALMIESLPKDKRPGQMAFREESFVDIKRGWDLYTPLPQTPEASEIWVTLEPKFKAWELAVKEFAAAQIQWDKTKEDGTNAEGIAAAHTSVKAKFGALGGHFGAVKSELDKLVKINSTLTAAATQSGREGAATAKTLMAGALGTMAVLGSVLAGLICINISRSISAVVSRVTEIQSSNDLTKRIDVKSNDEVGKLGVAFNGMLTTLQKIISEVRSGSIQIDAGGQQISAASQSLAQGASEQASSLQQISASMEEMSGQTQQSAENARQANALAMESKTSADRGQQEMVQMSKAVNEIKQSSSEISKIIKVIDEIAFQTNLLALNAAVEAARAGEAGKGFAVVAEEVRNLAQRSAEAAKNTASMIEESVKRSENGVQIANRVGLSLEEITSATNKVNTLLAEIAAAANEQATGIGQVSQGVSQLDQVTQQNAGNSEELASSAEEMSSQVSSLNDLVAQFKV